MEKELKINVPEGYEIDKENSTFERIRFKKKDDIYRHKCRTFDGYYSEYGQAYKLHKSRYQDYCLDEIFLFNTEKQAKSAVAMSQISQIMANDERFGGPITDEEWGCNDIEKYVIQRQQNSIMRGMTFTCHLFLAFHTKEQRDLFLEENEDLVKEYLMVD